jgi:hypothetical protein
MAIDLALQRSSKDGLRGVSSRIFPEELEPGNRKENFLRPLERERTWLAVYIASVGYCNQGIVNGRFAVGMRRPQVLDWSPHHSYCCQALIETGQSSDRRLVQIAQLLKLCQDISKTFCYDTRPKSLQPPPFLPLPLLQVANPLVQSYQTPQCTSQ